MSLYSHFLKIDLADQVTNFIRNQAPEPRRLLREGLRRLAREEGDLKELQGDLASFHRCRVGGFRIIFRYKVQGSQRILQCLLVERRAVVYQLFTDIVTTLRETKESKVNTTPRPVRYKASARKKAPRKSARKVVQ